MQCRNLVVVSDLHCGCRLGLTPPSTDAIPLDDGGFYQPSGFQRTVAEWWREFFEEFVPSIVKREKWALCVNGDAIEGVHHNSVTQISHNLADQAAIARMCLEPYVAKAKGGYYHIRGTEAHVGSSCQEEERLARDLGAIPNDEGQRARYDLWVNVGDSIPTHILHHIGVTGSQAYEATAVQKELVEEYAEAGRWNLIEPRMIVRSHRHRMITTAIPVRDGLAHAIVTPGWQGKTPHCYKSAGARITTPVFGGIIIRAGAEVGYYRERHWNIERSRME
jgi:hypothetical protein